MNEEKRCVCWARNDPTLPHVTECHAANENPRWLLFARLTMEFLRAPRTQLTLQRGRDGRRPLTRWGGSGFGSDWEKLDNDLFTLRFMLNPAAESRVMPELTEDEKLQTAEALSVALAEYVAAGAQGTPRAPAIDPTQELEQLRKELEDTRNTLVTFANEFVRAARTGHIGGYRGRQLQDRAIVILQARGVDTSLPGVEVDGEPLQPEEWDNLYGAYDDFHEEIDSGDIAEPPAEVEAWLNGEDPK